MFNEDDDKKINDLSDSEARRVTALFKKVFDTDEGKECLALLRNFFDTDTPSMALTSFDPLKSAYADGQKAYELEILQICAGKYLPIQKTNE
ncbi:hypothetical protein OAI07_01310 [Akkermansiaceae bacterium]|nr:hypothetical protein [Akkermansiaceae bacterium]